MHDPRVLNASESVMKMAYALLHNCILTLSV
ncbi:hypothetical protein GGQ68_002781 [Sagittula marina]|uniref:Uncharacterized protein n=1 Tax=Sagittula marina TaxID=943940 RepID=A0A7W6DT45_9RHOB|nr:hypothetical protein [Sagittula marina]